MREVHDVQEVQEVQQQYQLQSLSAAIARRTIRPSHSSIHSNDDRALPPSL